MADQPEGTSPRRTPAIASRVVGSGVRAGQRLAGATGMERALDVAAEEALVRALESPAIERALARLAEEGRLQQVLERIVAEADAEALVSRAIDSDAADRIWTEILASEKAQMLVERVAEAPEVRAAIAQQGFGLITDIGSRVSKLTEALDDAAERALLGLIGRSSQDAETNQVGLLTRGVAAAIDLALFAGVLSLVSGLFASIVPVAFGSPDGLPAAAVAGLGVLGFLVVGVVFVTFWSLVGQTPGMRFLGIRLDVDGSDEIGLRRSVRRLLAVPVALLPLGLGFLAIIPSAQRRGWHDRIAGTDVIYDESRAPWSAVPREWTHGDRSDGRQPTRRDGPAAMQPTHGDRPDAPPRRASSPR
jgi:uncharacterized RDD family membrane protein YckC